MVRETRHLWVGNLPLSIREDRILDHFKRYGKVQSVKILPKDEDGGGVCATVAFIDIKSAAKAHNADNKIDERTLKTDYYEPPASSTAASAIFIHERDNALVAARNPAPPPPPPPTAYATSRNARYGLPEDRNYERPGHYYERVNDREPYMRRPVVMGYHDEDNYQGRAKSRDRYVRSASGGTYTEGAERGQNHFRAHNARQIFEQTRYSEPYNDERDVSATAPRLNRRTNNASAASVVSSVSSSPPARSESRPRRNKRRSPSQSPSASRSNSPSRSRSRSSSGSRSSSSSSKLRSSSSDSSGRSWSPSKSRSPVTPYGNQSNAKRLERPTSAIANPSNMASYLPSSISGSAINCTSSVTNSQSPAPHQGSGGGCTTTQPPPPPPPNEGLNEKEEKKPLGICVRNLPVRSTDTSLKDGLFHEYKKHGKVTMVKVIGQGTDRYAVVCFKKPEDVEKALEVSKDKQFFGCKIEVTAHEGLDADDNEFRPLEAELDEYHPKATRTLFIGNLEKDITTAELRKHFDQFGEIIEIDIKKQGSATSYAFIQYSDIASVVKAMRKLDGENLGANRIKLGFGKSMPTNCVWLDGIADAVSEKYLARHFSRFGMVAYCAIDWEKGHALIFYESMEYAQIAVSEMRGRILNGKKLQVDFASRECQTTFFDKLEMTGQLIPGDRPWERRERRGAEFDLVRGDDRYGRDARVGFDRVYNRYDGQATRNRGNFRGIQRTGFCGRGRGQNFSNRYETFYDEFGERRHRYNSRDESGGESSSFDGKPERMKYGEPLECNNRKWNKLRNSISDQESHHSQSPPHSRHQSRSTSPVSKERKSLKDRLHHHIKSPGSHSSSQLNSPCRDSAADELPETDFKDFRVRNCDVKLELGDSDITLPLSSPKNSLLHDGIDKINAKPDGDVFRRRSIESENSEETPLTSEQLSQQERKRRLLAAAASVNKDSGVNAKMSNDRLKLKNSTSHSISSKLVQGNCISDCITDEKSDVESSEVNEENNREKTRSGNSANTDLKYLQKKQVHILQLLDQLRDGVNNSSDIEGSIENERYLQKKRSLSSVENVYNESDISKAVTKDECNSRLLKSGLKDQNTLNKSLSKSDTVDSNNCFSVSLDSYVFKKHLDPRKLDQYTMNSLPKCHRLSLDKDELSNNHGSGDSLSCDSSWKKQSLESNLSNSECNDGLSVQIKLKHEISDSCVNSQKQHSSTDIAKSSRLFPEPPGETKRERDQSPLSLPLPKFAATLRSPKSSPSTMTSPKSVAQVPHLLHSPNPHGCSKSMRISDISLDVNDRKSKEMCAEEKMNGITVSSATSSPSDFHSQSETSDAVYLETIQSPKNNSEKSREVTLSSDSDLSPISSPSRPSIEDRIKALDEKFNAWSGCTRAATNVVADVAPATVIDLPKCVAKRPRFPFHPPEVRTEPSDIVKSLLSKSTIFDQDSMRLQHIDEKYEPLNVKMNVSPKAKPAFRTKAAAKEFSTAIVPPLQAIGATIQSKTPTTVASHIVSSPSQSSLSAMTNAVSIASPSLSHFSQVPSQMYTPHSPCVTPFSSSRETEDTSFSLSQSACGDQAGLSPLVSVKVKSEPGSLDMVSQTHVGDTAPLNIKKESSPQTPVSELPALHIKKEPSTPLHVHSTLSENEEDKVTCKEETSHPLCTSSGKDCSLPLLKDQELCKSESTAEPNQEPPRRSSVDFHDSLGHWKEAEAVEDTAETVSKNGSNLDFSDLKLETPATKKRVSSMDSSESESGKSCKSLEMIRECHDSTKQEKEKHEAKHTESENKKTKSSQPHSARNHSPTPGSTSSYKKSEKKEKSTKSEKSKSSSSKKTSCSSVPEKDEDTKTAKSELKEKCKSDSYKTKEDKKSKSREHKDSSSSRGEEKTKSSEKQNSEKMNKSSSSRNGKSKKDSPLNRSEKPKTDKKSGEKKQSKSKLKQEFDLILDEEPVYFSMYDKVKARSSKQQTMKHQAKDLETMRQKFSKLKQSRAKREEKSKSVDSDKDSDSGSQHSSDSDAKTSKTKQQRKRKLVIESSSDDEMPQYSQSRNSKSESKDYSDSASDSDFDQKSVHKQSNKGRKKKPDIIESDSSDSEFHLTHQKSEMTGKRKLKSKNTQEKVRKIVKSEEGEGSDVGFVEKSQGKEKEHKRKKLKKAKTHERTVDRETSSKSSIKKISDDAKASRKVMPKEESQQSDSSLAAKAEASVKDKPESSCREKKVESSAEAMEVDGEDFKSFTRKKKKSKKAPKSKDKRPASDKGSSEFISSRKDEESESKSSLPVLLSPRPSSPIDDKPLSPPCLKAGDASENDLKTDLSDDDYDVVNRKSTESDTKHGNSTICNNQKANKKKETSFSHSKLHSELFDSNQDQVMTSFPEKGAKTTSEKEISSKGSSRTAENGRKRVLQSSSSKKGKEMPYENFHKAKHEKSEESSINSKHSDSKSFTGDSSLRDKRRRKMKKPQKDKKWKDKVEEPKEDRHRGNTMPLQPASPLLFESVSFDDSHLSDLRLNEEIAKEARQLEQELLAVSEETSTFGDEGPMTKKEEKQPERKFEEEAAKEAKRLEDELFSTGRDPWHMKEKPFGPESHNEELCSDSKDIDADNDALVIKDEIFPELALHSSSLGDAAANENDIFLASNNSDQYKLEDKDAVSEIDDQRKIEDDLAVSALLQEMNNSDISAPELTKEADYLEPLMNAQPEDTMNYLLPDEGDNSLHIVDHSPELLVNENSNGKLDNDGITLSPSSNLEPPSLEISSFEESVTLKNYEDNKSAASCEIKSDEISEPSNKPSLDSTAVINLDCVSLPLTDSTEAANPPIIDIPSGTATLQAVPESSSPKSSKKAQRKRWLDQTPENLLQDVTHHSASPLSELPKNTNEKFESTSATNKDDDNPPVLLPVDLQPRLEPETEPLKPVSVRSADEINIHCSDSAVMHGPKIKEQELPKAEEGKQTQNIPLSLNDFEDSCGNLAPLNIASFSPNLEEPDFKIPDVSKEENNNNNRNNIEPLEPHPNFESNPAISEPSGWKTPDTDLKPHDTYSPKFSGNKEPAKSPNSLYYTSIFQQSDIPSSNRTDIKNDISVIKSTANAIADSLSNELPEKTVPDSYHPDMITSENYLSNVFSPVKDNRAGVIFNTSEIENSNCDIRNNFPSLAKDDFSNVKEKLKSEDSKPQDVPLEKDATLNSTSNDRFDILRETPKPPPLHFPPLFTIPTTEPLLSPTNENPSSVIEEKSAPAINSESLPDKKEKEVKDILEEPSSSETTAVEQDEPIASEQPVVSLAETLSKMEENLEDGEILDKKSRGADVESVSSDTTDITFPDIKADLELNQVMSSEEQVQEEVSIPEKLIVPEQRKPERPRRGRKPKGRKLGSNSRKADNSSSSTSTSTSARGKRTRTVSFERTRRSLRSSDTTDHLLSSDKGSSPEDKNIAVPSVEQETEAQKISNDEHSQTETTTSVNRVELVISHDETSDGKTPDKVYNTRAEETKRQRRGRRKKLSGDNQNTNSFEKSDPKSEDHSKDFSRPKESRLWLLSSEKDHRGVKDNTSSIDVYDFHGSDEEATFEGNLQPSVKERLHDNSRTTVSSQDPKTDNKSPEVQPEKEKSDTSSQKVPTNEEAEVPSKEGSKEGSTEVTQPAKLSMTIRIQRDGTDGTSTGTAAVVKSSLAVAADDVKQDTKAEKSNACKDTSSTDSSHSGPSKNTRKSTRLMNQAAARSNYDEIIAEVAKGNFKSSAAHVEPSPSRVTRRSRASRKSEENITNAYSDTFEDPTEDKNKSEPMFVILDNTVKDAPDNKKSLSAHSVDATPASDTNSKPEKNVRSASLLNFRILRSSASKLDTQKESSVSETTHDTDSRKKETTNFVPPEEKKDISTVSQQEKKESSILLPDTVPYRPPLPVLKVKVPRSASSCGKETHVGKLSTEVKSEEHEEDSDSRSSPAFWLDPVTGFLTSETEKTETPSDNTESSLFATNTEAKGSSSSAAHYTPLVSTVATAKIGIKDVKLSKDEKSSSWDQSLKTTVSVLAGPYSTCPPTSAMKKEISPLVPDVQQVSTSDTVNHAIDLKSPNTGRSKQCTRVGVLTPVVINTTSSIDTSKTVTACASSHSPAIQSSSIPPLGSTSPARPPSNSLATLRLPSATVVQSAIPSPTITSSSPPATVASAHSPLVRTVVTAVVTVASSESSTTHSIAFPTKCSSTLPLPLSAALKSEVSPLHVGTAVVPQPATDAAPLACTTKGSPPEPLSNAQHWSPSSAKYISSASPAASSSSNSWSNAKIPSQTSVVSEKPTNLSSAPAGSYQPLPVGKTDARASQPAHSHLPKSSAFYQQLGYHPTMYESAQNLSANSSGGVIADLLQNPQLLQHKEYHSGNAGSSSQFPDRNQSQTIRPSTPSSAGIPPEVAARLGNPTPPHTPTPLVNTSTHSLPQSTDIHTHVAAGLHLRAAAAYGLGLSSWEMNPYVHNSQMIYAAAAAHPQYAAMHPEFRAQQEAQARASMGISPCLPYPAVPPGATVSPGNFRQPLEPRLAHSADHKSEGKTSSEVPEPVLERRVHGTKSSRVKKEDSESKKVRCDEYERPGSAPQSSRLCQELVHYSSAVRQEERKTDSPAKYAAAQVRALIADPLKESKVESAVPLPHPHLVKADGTERELNPPAAHQPHMSTSYHTFESPAFPGVRQPLLGVPQVPSPTPVFDGRSAAQPSHSSSAYLYKKNSHISQNMSSSDKLAYDDVSKKLLDRSIGHQGSSISPGLGTPQVIQQLNTHPLSQSAHRLIPQNGQMNNIPNTHAAALVMTPPLAPQATANDADVASKHPIMWQGLLALKNEEAAVQMHYVFGNEKIASDSLPYYINVSPPTLRISQRMKLETAQLQGVTWKMANQKEHCILMALPCGTNHEDVVEQSSKLKSGFITYLESKQAAGIVNIGNGTQQPAFVIHIFPPMCEFSRNTLSSKAPYLAKITSDITHLVIIITTA